MWYLPRRPSPLLLQQGGAITDWVGLAAHFWSQGWSAMVRKMGAEPTAGVGKQGLCPRPWEMRT